MIKDFYVVLKTGAKYKTAYCITGGYGGILDTTTNLIKVVNEYGKQGVVQPKEVDWEATKHFNYADMTLKLYIFHQKRGTIEVKAFDMNDAKLMAINKAYKTHTSTKFYSVEIKDLEETK